MATGRSWAVLLAPAVVAAGALAADGDALLGLWQTEPDVHGFAHVRITREGGQYVGRIVWLSTPNDADDPDGVGGQPKTDRENPDPALRDRPIVGIELVQGFDYAGDGRWKNGTIYDPQNGKTTSAACAWPTTARCACAGSWASRSWGAPPCGFVHPCTPPEPVGPPPASGSPSQRSRAAGVESASASSKSA